MRSMGTAICSLPVLTICCVLCPSPGFTAEDIPRITKEEAKAHLGAPKAVFIDARTDAAWGASDKKMRAAAPYR